MAQRVIKIGVSSCLLGESVRYDGTDKYQPLIVNHLAGRFELVSVCPEMAIGLPSPRPPIQRVRIGGELHLLRVDDVSFDLTDKMRLFATQSVKSFVDLSGFIFKTRSPSCGLTGVKFVNEEGRFIDTGEGAFAEIICSQIPQLPVIEECELTTLHQVEMFADRVEWFNQAFPGVSG